MPVEETVGHVDQPLRLVIRHRGGERPQPGEHLVEVDPLHLLAEQLTHLGACPGIAVRAIDAVNEAIDEPVVIGAKPTVIANRLAQARHD